MFTRASCEEGAEQQSCRLRNAQNLISHIAIPEKRLTSDGLPRRPLVNGLSCPFHLLTEPVLPVANRVGYAVHTRKVFLLQASAVETAVLRNDNGLEAHIIDTGAVIQRLFVPDADGNLGDIVAGFDALEDYDVSCQSSRLISSPSCHFNSKQLLHQAHMLSRKAKAAGVKKAFGKLGEHADLES